MWIVAFLILFLGLYLAADGVCFACIYLFPSRWRAQSFSRAFWPLDAVASLSPTLNRLYTKYLFACYWLIVERRFPPSDHPSPPPPPLWD